MADAIKRIAGIPLTLGKWNKNTNKPSKLLKPEIKYNWPIKVQLTLKSNKPRLK